MSLHGTSLHAGRFSLREMVHSHRDWQHCFFPRQGANSLSPDFAGDPFIFRAKRQYEPLPNVGGIEFSSTMFRRNPDIPIVPSRALEYIQEHCLYGVHRDSPGAD